MSKQDPNLSLCFNFTASALEKAVDRLLNEAPEDEFLLDLKRTLRAVAA